MRQARGRSHTAIEQIQRPSSALDSQDPSTAHLGRRTYAAEAQRWCCCAQQSSRLSWLPHIVAHRNSLWTPVQEHSYLVAFPPSCWCVECLTSRVSGTSFPHQVSALADHYSTGISSIELSRLFAVSCPPPRSTAARSWRRPCAADGPRSARRRGEAEAGREAGRTAAGWAPPTRRSWARRKTAQRRGACPCRRPHHTAHPVASPRTCSPPGRWSWWRFTGVGQACWYWSPWSDTPYLILPNPCHTVGMEVGRRRTVRG